MTMLDFSFILFSIFEHLPVDILPELSWTCRSLRSLATSRAPAEIVDLDIVEIGLGRWLLHHKANIAARSSQGITHRHLEILAASR